MKRILIDTLDLCIEKSKDNVFYSFAWYPADKKLVIKKCRGHWVLSDSTYKENDLESALKFMENE